MKRVQVAGQRQRKRKNSEDDAVTSGSSINHVDQNGRQINISVNPAKVMNNDNMTDFEVETDGCQEMSKLQRTDAFSSNERKSGSGAGFGYTEVTKKFRIHKDTETKKAHNGNDVNQKLCGQHEDKEMNTCNAKDNKQNPDNVCTQSNKEGQIVEPKEYQVCGTCRCVMNDLDDDGIKTRQLLEKRLTQKPKEIPDDYPDLPPHKNTRINFCACVTDSYPLQCKESRIYIQHVHADTSRGDPFGATLRTFTDRDSDKSLYYIHLLVDLESNTPGPAIEMRIREKDEIGLLNDEFAPHMKHTELLDRFRKVKVDGKTRFFMVIRRAKHENGLKRPEWIKISAVFFPDRLNDHTVARSVKDEPLGDKGYDTFNKVLLKLEGTQRFLEILDRTISADVLQGPNDDSKDVWRKTHYKLDDSTHIVYYSCILDKTKTSCIAVDKSLNVVMDTKDYFFRWSRMDANVAFKLDSSDKYLAFETDKKKAVLQPWTFYFEEYPAEIKHTLFKGLCRQSQNNVQRNEGGGASAKDSDKDSGIGSFEVARRQPDDNTVMPKTPVTPLGNMKLTSYETSV